MPHLTQQHLESVMPFLVTASGYGIAAGLFVWGYIEKIISRDWAPYSLCLLIASGLALAFYSIYVGGKSSASVKESESVAGLIEALNKSLDKIGQQRT